MTIQGKLFHFEAGRVIAADLPAPAIGTPCIYILSESGLLNPLYIGEYGKSKTYNVVGRIKNHFNSTGTLRRLSRNMQAFKLTVPSRVSAFVVELEEEFKKKDARCSLEAWIIFIVCNQLKIHDHRFAVTKYGAPSADYESLAREIVRLYASSN